MGIKTKKLKGGALLLTILIAAILMALTTGLLLLLQYQREYSSRAMRHERLQQHLRSATNLLLTGDTVTDGDTSLRSLFNAGRDSVLLIRKPWGAYDIGIVHAFEGQDTLRAAFLMGKTPTLSEQYALYLADETRPLSISGHTEIRGDAYLPEAGIRKALIENQQYHHAQEIFGGEIRHSQATLPALNPEILARLSSLLGNEVASPSHLPPATPLPDLRGMVANRSFYGPVEVWTTTDSLFLDDVTINGHILLASEGPITVSAEAALENVMLFAPTIRFMEGFSGCVQAYARDSIIVGQSCLFNFPSVVGLINVPDSGQYLEYQPLIRVDSLSEINGLVFSHFKGTEHRLALVSLQSGATVNGQVYADGLLELKGTVNGATMCRRFSLQTPSSIYENFILHGVMDYAKRSPYYAGSMLIHAGRKGKAIKWLDDIQGNHGRR